MPLSVPSKESLASACLEGSYFKIQTPALLAAEMILAAL